MANIHVYKEILELCYTIDSEGEPYSEKSPHLKAIPFGELFNVRITKHFDLIFLSLSANIGYIQTDLRADQQ